MGARTRKVAMHVSSERVWQVRKKKEMTIRIFGLQRDELFAVCAERIGGVMLADLCTVRAQNWYSAGRP